MKKKILGVTLIVTLAVVAAFNINLNKSNTKGNLALANVEALADDEINGNPCGDINYVPDRYIVSQVFAGTYTCTTSGELQIGSNKLSGSYVVGNSYNVSIQNSNCSGQQKYSCCDQRLVGASLIN